MSNPSKPNRGELVSGLLASLIGLFVIVLSQVSGDSSFNVPRWIVTLVGILFFLAGLVVVRAQALDSGRDRRSDLVSSLLVALVFKCF